MRPLRLEIEGFTAFKDLVTLDMEDLDLFAITGPTGAGKSSLIDAICYALYGKVPRVANEVASCISQDRDRMRVTYEFAAAGERYRVFRETRRRGTPNVRLERCVEGDWRAVVDRARDVNAQVSEIVGLDYEGFTRSVILPQGQFQEFLAGSAEKRRAVLSSLLRLEVYERMRKRASTMAGETKIKLDERKRTLDALADATPENMLRLEAERDAAIGQIEALKCTLESLDGAVVLAMTLNRAREAVSKSEDEARDALAAYDKTRRVLDEGDAGLEALVEARADTAKAPRRQRLRARDSYGAGHRPRARQGAVAGQSRASTTSRRSTPTPRSRRRTQAPPQRRPKRRTRPPRRRWRRPRPLTRRRSDTTWRRRCSRA